jgi:hypothetical protein
VSRPDAAQSDRMRLAALQQANRVRKVRAELKRRLRARETAAAEAILGGSRDTDTMTVKELLISQPGWGPSRCSRLLRGMSLSDTKTLGALTERQRVMLASVLSRDASDL